MASGPTSCELIPTMKQEAGAQYADLIDYRGVRRSCDPKRATGSCGAPHEPVFDTRRVSAEKGRPAHHLRKNYFFTGGG